MSIVTDSNSNPVEVVGHYTDSAGLIGITSSGAIRATNIRHLNDSEEYYRLFDAFKHALQRELDHNGDHFGELEKSIFMLGTRVFGVSLFSISFSTQTDLLSQWRGYSQGAQGYCLVFEKSLLSSRAEALGWSFVKCQYMEHQELQGHVDRILNPLVSELRQEALGGRIQTAGLHNILTRNHSLLAASIKHPGFAEENEYRLVAGRQVRNDQGLQFRASQHGIIPFTDFRFRTSREPLAAEDDGYECRPGGLAQVIIGPGTTDEKSSDLGEMLREFGYFHVGTSFTRTPFQPI